MTSTHNTSLDLIRELLAEIGNPLDGGIDPAVATLQEIGLDSLSILELLMLIDEHTGVEVGTEQIGTDTTLLGLAALIDQQSAG